MSIVDRTCSLGLEIAAPEVVARGGAMRCKIGSSYQIDNSQLRLLICIIFELYISTLGSKQDRACSSFDSVLRLYNIALPSRVLTVRLIGLMSIVRWLLRFQ